ncbi:conserved hypothetical protein [Caldicellulosiruptor hydrothermalis 108]|uniref:Transposase (putative) YhgA-like domain-containing protein n=1 Tax=Caldicellulosiruptor hydrothermalis (strain DSM 18901 / VKM B-2411 / 108) TaxID=632292 RepID=E4QAZ2_CALH1|nr:Rpn family recombination-promoting nuclease/putative transposase [Caldicellulosiruptor hydrothermalis]ADQ08298.1 conserved hypothetical protein [Caldicellulosiruptor hydrothermalis 108]
MESNIPSKEHDITFKLLFEHPKDILFLIKDVIGYSWANNIQEDSIELEDKEMIDEDFKKNIADIVAKAKLKDREVYFYIIIENQSTVVEDMPERLLRYMILLWAKKIRQGCNKLPAIVPIVTYNGLDRKWNISQQIIDAFDVFKDDIFKYALVDISNINAKELIEKEKDVLSPIVFYLEQVRDDGLELVKRLEEIIPSTENLSKVNQQRFILWANNVIRPRLLEEHKKKYDEFVEKLEKGGRRMGEFISNVARLLDETNQKQFNKGIQQGRLEERIEIVKKLIRRGFSDQQIAELIEIEVEEVKKIRETM